MQKKLNDRKMERVFEGYFRSYQNESGGHDKNAVGKSKAFTYIKICSGSIFRKLG